MTITVGARTTAGTYPITVTGNGGGTQQTTTVTLTVTAGLDSPSPLRLLLSASCRATREHRPLRLSSVVASTARSVCQLGDAYRYNGYLQSQLDPGPGFGQLDHDDHRRIQDPDGDLSHHRHGKWRWNPSNGDGNSNGHSAGSLTWTPSSSPGIAGYNAIGARLQADPTPNSTPALTRTQPTMIRRCKTDTRITT